MKRHIPHSIINATLAAAILGTIPSSALAAPPAADLGYARGRILVEPRAGLSDAEFDKILKAHGGKRRKLGQSKLHVVDLPGNLSEADVVAKLSRNPHLKYAELDRRVRSSLAVNDPYAGSEWHLAKVGAGTAWDTSQGTDIAIAILDSGVDTTHPDLQPNLVAGYNMYDNNTNVSDVCGHGTAVAGTAAASSNNGIGVAGVAGKARIMPIRVAYFDAASNNCYAYYSTIANGLTWAADHGARVANASFGGVAGSAAIQSAARYMKNKGGLVFVSAGNAGIDENIAPTTTMIAVSATEKNDVKTSWSSYGSFVALSAPGAGIWTTSKGGIYQAWNGTSFSSPLAAGVAALMMAAQTSLDGSRIEQLMFSTALDLGAAGRDPLYGHGRVNAAAAVKAAATPVVTQDTQTPTSSIVAPLAGSTVSALVAVDVSASDNVGVTRVELRVNDTLVALDDAAPYSFSWNSAGVPNGMANLTATAYDFAGNAGGSATVAVNVANATTPVTEDTTAPIVTITNPSAGSVYGTVTVSVSASDNGGAAGISHSLYIDGALKAGGTGASLAYSWNTHKVKAGIHTLQAVAKDAAGNTSTTSVQVTVSK
jgi:thermitase